MSKQRKYSRRQFLRRTAVAGAAGAVAGAGAAGSLLGAGPTVVPACVLGGEGKKPPSEKIQLGLIGAGGMGRANLANCAKYDDVEVTAIAEVWQERLEAALKSYPNAKGFRDYRELLVQKNVDAVIIASPPHWHALHAIDACEAGKHIYLQKPMTLTLGESLAVVAAVKKHNRISQVGTQIHASANYRKVVNYIRSGLLGPISVARSFNVYNFGPEGIGNDPNCDPPPGLDWQMWVGPARMRPFNPLVVRDSFTHSGFMDYGGGWTPCWAPHILDLPIWALELGLPTMVAASGGRFVVQDAGDAYDTHEILLQYPKVTVTWMMSQVNSYGFDAQGQPGTRRRLGTYFQGVNGTLFADYSTHKIIPEGDRLKDIPPEPPKVVPDSPGHEREWLDCIRSGQQPSANVEYHHKVNVPIVLGNLSLRLGRAIRLDPNSGWIVGDEEAARLSVPEYRPPWKFPRQYLAEVLG
jgi:predicted dehydrogenase